MRLKQAILGALRCKIIVIAILLFAETARGQYVSIPDTNFVKWLRFYGYGNCMNGSQLDTNCAIQTSANNRYCNISYWKISTFEGLQYFRYLDSLRLNSDTGLVYIPDLPPHVKVFECRNNYLDSLPKLPDSLQRLVCDFNQLTKLPTLPATLTYLSCINNRLDTLPKLSDSLTLLYCSGNSLDSLPQLPAGLRSLSCFGNNLSALPTLPSGLQLLSCSRNALTTLPNLPLTLTYLDCYNNHLTVLPALPDSLNTLTCSSNQLTVLPALPAALTSLNCEKNNLTALPQLPDSLSILYCDNNPSLFCLPEIKIIGDLEFYNTGISCTPNYGNVATSNPSLGSMQLCQPGNAHACLVISGINTINPRMVKLHPNPTSNVLHIEAVDELAGAVVKVFATDGKEMMHQNVTALQTNLQVSNLPTGIYFIQLTSKQGSTLTARFVKE